MKNGHRAKRWRIWHARRIKKQDLFYRLNVTTRRYINDHLKQLVDNIFAQSPLMEFLSRYEGVS